MMGSHCLRVSFARQGRITGSRTSAANIRRRAVVASGPMIGKTDLASDALHWIDSIDITSSATEKKGDVVDTFMAQGG